MIISIIVAMDEKRGIGKDNSLMWRIPGELARFKSITMGHPIIMGRKTFESLPGKKILPGRTNIIISRDKNYKVEGGVVVGSLEEAIERAQSVILNLLASRRSGFQDPKYEEMPKQVRHDNSKADQEIFIIGGGQIFQQALPMADRLYLTLVEGDFGADVFFPDYSAFTKVISEEKREGGGYKYTFLTLDK